MRRWVRRAELQALAFPRTSSICSLVVIIFCLCYALILTEGVGHGLSKAKKCKNILLRSRRRKEGDWLVAKSVQNPAKSGVTDLARFCDEWPFG
jgi:hypothetical protein